MEEVKLHGFWYSPFVWRVVWTLKLKGIPYDYTEEDYSNKSAQLLKYNPVHKKVPVLVHAEKPICESMVIVEYIDETWPQNPLLPADPYERALARFWAKYVDDDNMVSAVLALLFSSTGEELEKAIEKIWEHFRVVEDQCFGDEKKFFGGDTINIVDLAFGSIISFLEIGIVDIFKVKILEAEKFPRFHSWFINFKDVPVIAEIIPDPEKLVAYVKSIREKRSISFTK
ncbi:probable glutathione S-transferase [Gastrolobium bilobum]|uniref:probable glutathione S-transferase n=1 Tax=Gastrolobium bilobum TaxID=150636 RepID=UPI002AB2610C|nr:probable glutathione S-transferase [Gastrolobium bilobum]